MPTASEHAERVLSAIIPDRIDLLDRAQQQLTEAHFTEAIHTNLFKLLERYSDVAGGVLTRDALEDMLRGNTDPGRAELYLETYDTFRDTAVAETDFAWSVSELKDLAAERATKEVLADGMEVLTRGKDQGRGVVLKGHEDARNYLLEAFSNIDRDLTMIDSPEGDMRKERVEILADYAENKRRREAGTQDGIKFGITELDNTLGGIQPGEFALVAAYSSDGKTSLCVQLAWHAAVKQGKNVVFFTTETVNTVVRRKIVSRHSKESQFNLPDGLNTRDLKMGTLTEVQEMRLQEVVLDLETNPNYGKIYIVQVPRDASILTLEHRMYRLLRQFPIDLVVVDYLAQFRADQSYPSEREKLSSILKEAKRLAVTFNHGAGVPLVSPWQINRSSREEAMTTGFYTKKATAETAEATNSPDILITLLPVQDSDERYQEARGQLMKNRDGETSNAMRFDVDYATSTFLSKDEGGSLSAKVRANTSTFGGDEHLALLDNAS